ncbi:MAG: translation initiation factor IF-2 subunit alpha, partial [Thermoplasmatota archaeon]
IKATNDHQKRETIQAWKNEQKADKFLQILAEREGTTVDKIMVAYGRRLVEVFGTVYQAFQEAAEYGEDAFKQEGLQGPWVAGFVAFAKENIQASFVDIAGYVDIQSPAPDGVKHVAKALKAAEKSEFDDVTIEVAYMGAPHYRITVKAPDFKIAEDQMKLAADRAIAVIQKTGGTGAFQRELAVAKTA